MTKFEVTMHRRHKGGLEKRVETVEAGDSGEAMDIILERTEGASWRIDKIEEV